MIRTRVLHLITRLERGGSSDCTLWQAIGAARRGYSVTLASGPTDAPTPLLERAKREPHLELVGIPSLIRPLRPLADLKALWSIVRLLRSRRFDVIHLHTSKAGALGRLAALLTGRTGSVIHQPHGHLFYGYYGPLGSRLVVLAERALAPLARLQITLSRSGAEEHLARGVGRADQFRALPSGVDFRPLRRARSARSACRRRLGCAPEDLLVLSLCRLEAIKGAVDLVRGFASAARIHPRLRLVIAGEGPQKAEIEALADEAGLSDRVRLVGGWSAPSELLPAADIFVLASRNEGMGRALVEAMAFGIPVVGTSVGGVPELLQQGDAGLLVPPGDAAALGAALIRLAEDRSFAAALGGRGRSRAVAYGAGRMAHRLVSLYKEVAA